MAKFIESQSPLNSALKGLLEGVNEGTPFFLDRLGQREQSKMRRMDDAALKRLGIDIEGVQDPKTRQALLEGHQRKELAQTPKPVTEITPYQHELIKQRSDQLELQQKRLESAREKERKDLPQMISTYTKSYAKELGLKPDEKVELDSFVKNAYVDNKMDLNDALSHAVEQLAQKREALESVTGQLPNRPFGADFRGDARNQAMQKTAMTLKQAFDVGIASQKQVGEILKSKGWKPDEIGQIMNFIENTEDQQQAPQEKALEKFDSRNPKHVARAKQLLAETGDRAKANALLSQEFSK